MQGSFDDCIIPRDVTSSFLSLLLCGYNSRYGDLKAKSQHLFLYRLLRYQRTKRVLISGKRELRISHSSLVGHVWGLMVIT